MCCREGDLNKCVLQGEETPIKPMALGSLGWESGFFKMNIIGGGRIEEEREVCIK